MEALSRSRFFLVLLLLVFSPNSYSVDAATAVQNALRSTCDALAAVNELEGAILRVVQVDLDETCELVDGTGGSADDFRQLAHEEITAQGSNTIQNTNVQNNNLGSRMQAVRAEALAAAATGVKFTSSAVSLDIDIDLNGRSIPISAFNKIKNVIQTDSDSAYIDNEQWLFSSYGQLNADSEDASTTAQRTPFGKLGVFLNARASTGDRDDDIEITGFDFDSLGITAGIDYRFKQNAVIGAAVGYSYTDADLDRSSGDSEIDSYYFSIFGTRYFENKYYINATATIGYNEYDTERAVVIPSVNINQDAKGSTTGTEYSLSLGGGYNFSHNKWSFGPYAQVIYADYDIDGYRERASSSGAGFGSLLSIDDQDIESFRTKLGGQIAYVINTSHAVYSPQLRLDWEHEFNDDKRDITASFTNDPSATLFDIQTASPDRDVFNLGAGVAAKFAHNRSGFIYIESLLGDSDYSRYFVEASFKMKF